MGYEQLVESQLQDAIARGLFTGLPGEGKPLDLDESSRLLAGDNWLGHKILRDNELLPEWLGIAREVEDLQARVDALDARHAELVALVAASGDWDMAAPALARAVSQFEIAARQLRARQDELNVKAPGRHSERPAIWVEFHLQRLEARAVAAGRP
jgi:hypothetical protein